MLLKYDVSIVGTERVNQALSSLEQRFARHNATMRSAGFGGSRGSSGSPSADFRRVAAETRAVNRVASMRAAEEKRAQQQINKEARARLQYARVRAAEEKRSADAELRAQNKRAKAEEAAIKRKAVEQRRMHGEQLRDSRRLQAEQKRHWNEQQRHSLKQIRAAERFGRNTANTAIGGAAHTLGRIGTYAALSAGVAGVSYGRASVNQALDLEDKSRRLSVMGRYGGAGLLDVNSTSKNFTKLGIQYGMDPTQVADASIKMQELTGSRQISQSMLPTVLASAQASGSSAEDVAQLVGALKNAFNISDVKEMQKTMAMFYEQGKKGAFELSHMAEWGTQAMSVSAALGLKSAGDLASFGGLMQLAKKATGNNATSGTDVRALLMKLPQRAAKLASGVGAYGHKVNVFEDGDPTKGLRPIRETLPEIVAAYRGNKTELGKTLDKRAYMPVAPMIDRFSETYHGALGKGATDADAAEMGRKAVQDLIDDMSGAGGEFRDVQADAAEVMKSTSVQLEILNTKIKDAINSELYSVFQQMVPEMERLLPAIRDAAKFTAELVLGFKRLLEWTGAHPFEALVAAIAAGAAMAVGKEAVTVAVSAALTRAILRAQVGGPGGAIGAPGGIGGPVGGPGAPGRGGGGVPGGARATIGSFLANGVAGGLVGYGIASVGDAIGAASGDATVKQRTSATGVGAMLGGVLGPAGAIAGGAAGNYVSGLSDLVGMMRSSNILDPLKMGQLLGEGKTFTQALGIQGSYSSSPEAMKLQAASLERMAAEQRLKAVAEELTQALTKAADAANGLGNGGLNRGPGQSPVNTRP